MKANEILKAVNNNLRWWPWGGECFEVHQNEWGEWIANCHVWGQYGRSPEDPKWRYYAKGDKDCPVRQFMVEIINETELWVHLWAAKDDKRLPTFMESGEGENGDGGLFDHDAPKSPYIKTREPSEEIVF